MTLANISGLITGINQDFDDAVGAIVTRREVYEQYLDAENFDNGNPQADPTMESVSRYEIEQCTAQQAEFVTYTLFACFARQMALYCPPERFWRMSANGFTVQPIVAIPEAR